MNKSKVKFMTHNQSMVFLFMMSIAVFIAFLVAINLFPANVENKDDSTSVASNVDSVAVSEIDSKNVMNRTLLFALGPLLSEKDSVRTYIQHKVYFDSRGNITKVKACDSYLIPGLPEVDIAEKYALSEITVDYLFKDFKRFNPNGLYAYNEDKQSGLPVGTVFSKDVFTFDYKMNPDYVAVAVLDRSSMASTTFIFKSSSGVQFRNSQLFVFKDVLDAMYRYNPVKVVNTTLSVTELYDVIESYANFDLQLFLEWAYEDKDNVITPYTASNEKPFVFTWGNYLIYGCKCSGAFNVIKYDDLTGTTFVVQDRSVIKMHDGKDEIVGEVNKNNNASLVKAGELISISKIRELIK